MSSTRPKDRSARAFTIIELLVVIAVIALLIALGGAAASGTISSMRLTSAAQTLSAKVAEARQLAMTSNREVEFRIYLSDPHASGSAAHRSYAFGTVEPQVDPTAPDYNDPASPGFAPPFVPASPPTTLPQGLAFLPDAPYSTLIAGGGAPGQDIRRGEEPSPDGGTSLPFVSFTLLPEGRAPLDPAITWTLSLALEELALRPGATLPKDFTTLQLLPSSGRARTFRP